MNLKSYLKMSLARWMFFIPLILTVGVGNGVLLAILGWTGQWPLLITTILWIAPAMVLYQWKIRKPWERFWGLDSEC